MGIFNMFKKDFNLREVPLSYWEEYSYMIAIPEKGDYSWSPEEIIKRISSIKDIEVLDSRYDREDKRYYLNLMYDKEEYKIGFFPGGFSLPESYINNAYNFTEEEIDKLKEAKSALTIFMKFGNDVKKSFHLQLRIASLALPNLIGLVDESAERLLPSRWVLMAAKSAITPGVADIFNVHAVYSKNGEVWLHTHGLNRCNITELEVLKSDMKNYINHFNLIASYASFLIDTKKGKEDENGTYLGIFKNGDPMMVTSLSWTKALSYYDKLTLGGIKDRIDGHNSRTSPIFIYVPSDKNKKLGRVSDFNDLWGEDPIFFFSDDETDRMKKLAAERFSYVEEAYKNKENKIMVKIGLECDNKEDLEHIWFEVIDFKDDKFLAKLTQKPYNVSSIKVGDERWFTKEDVTDFQIYTKKRLITPDNVYLLKESE